MLHLAWSLSPDLLLRLKPKGTIQMWKILKIAKSKSWKHQPHSSFWLSTLLGLVLRWFLWLYLIYWSKWILNYSNACRIWRLPYVLVRLFFDLWENSILAWICKYLFSLAENLWSQKHTLNRIRDEIMAFKPRMSVEG